MSDSHHNKWEGLIGTEWGRGTVRTKIPDPIACTCGFPSFVSGTMSGCTNPTCRSYMAQASELEKRYETRKLTEAIEKLIALGERLEGHLRAHHLEL